MNSYSRQGTARQGTDIKNKMKTNLPFELLHYEAEDIMIDLWYYPVIEIIRIYYNRFHFDTIRLKKEYPKTWIEHPMLGRMAV